MLVRGSHILNPALDRGLVKESAETRRKFVTGEGERGRNQIWYAVDTSWDAVDTRCLAGQVNNTIYFQL